MEVCCRIQRRHYTQLYIYPFLFVFHIRIVGMDVYAAVTIRLHEYGNEHTEQMKDGIIKYFIDTKHVNT
jgi:hypothetical protein